ncbi:acetate kinase [Chitinivorax tropicus]|uniref:Acetate kinase n=1 Tax=Chitinivorax tropicus TaxID=714531 RepID=A0A840MQR5_9PROT|nr:acetate/propionate family kinase [Chitinivorax tropicus]MBB5017581.1 acetate kinase [Chitinivorax tropicus]
MQGLLVVNAGSSSLKFAVYTLDATLSDPIWRGALDGLPKKPHARIVDQHGNELINQAVSLPAGEPALAPCRWLLAWLASISDITLHAVGHRIVHGGTDFATPVWIDADVLKRLHGLIPLAPLHQPGNLLAVEAIANQFPGLPQLACFDTSFHRSQPALAQLYALPQAITAQGVRAYGFHGLSYEYIISQLADIAPQHAQGKLIVAHLGNGASMCAIEGGRSVASSMGFTALDGLMMGTRCGNLDPGVMLYLMAQGMDYAALERLLYRESGLLGVSGLSSDMRDLQASEQAAARQAVDLFCYRAGRMIGSLAAALQGLDTLIFTGGIGEHAAPVRAKIIAHANWLGATLDEGLNDAHAPIVSPPGSRVRVRVMATDEEAVIARHLRQRL